MCENCSDFVHLHTHSEYSLLDGLSQVDELVSRAAELGQPALALTDHGAMYGTIEFYRACKTHDIKPIIGLETYIAARKMTDRDATLDKKRFHLLLLAQNQTGYLNLLQTASAAQLDGYYYKPRVDRDFLSSHADGLIATTGCMAAEIPQALLNNNMPLAKRLMGQYLDIFGKDNFFVEFQEHHIPELTDLNRKLLELAPHFGLEKNYLATNDVHYTRAEDADPHEVLLCIQTSSTVNAPKLTFSDKEYYLKSSAEMNALFGEIPGALSNSLLIAERCDVDLDSKGYHLPQFEVPAGFTAASYLRHLCEEGLKWRYGDERAANSEELHHRLNHELNIIGTMGFDTYFLIVWDLCEFARRTRRWWDENGALLYPGQSYDEWASHDIWWNTRGSAAGSIVAYTLGITSIDPLENQLIFERFLNPGRVSMPDIDLDYPDDRRHEMVEYTMRRYGADKVAQIITFGKMKARAAVRDVGRAMDIPLERVDQIARMIPAVPGKKILIHNLFEEGHEFYSREFVESYNKDPQMRELVDTAQQLEGVSRHASSHAAGVIISDKPLVEYCPLNRPTSGSEGLGGLDRVTQWPMEIVESIGLLKVDFLGLSTLTVLRTAARLIEARHGVVYEMDNIPYDMGHVGPDPSKKPDKLFDMLAEGNVGGVFQVEGAGMRRLMMEMQPRRFDHIVAAISLYRPGPMENIPLYIERMHSEIFKGKDIVQYHTPKLETALKDTYGIIVYQEQIIRIATDLAGYEPGEADMIRKAVAKKKEALMEEHRVKFTDGALSRGESEEVINAIWDDIKFFARYGFPKGHAASYGRITCQTAFLKAHYPVEYMAALLSVEREKTEKVRKYVAEAKNLGIGIEPPDINLSGLSFTIEDAADRPVIRFGMAAIKNVGEAAVNTILVEREANGPFKSLQDLADRVDLRKVGKRALEFMIKGQVFRRWGSVAQMLDGLDRIVSDSGKTHEAASIGQMSLFGALGGDNGSNMKRTSTLLRPSAEVAEIEHKKLLEWEKEALSVHVSEHPLERPLAQIGPYANTTIGDLDANWNGKQVRLAGMIASLRPYTTKKGDPMAFAALEDLEGQVDLVFFPRTWQATRELVAVDQVMLVIGTVQASEDRLTILVDTVRTNLDVASSMDSMLEPLLPGPGIDEPEEATWTPPPPAPPRRLAAPVAAKQPLASADAAGPARQRISVPAPEPVEPAGPPANLTHSAAPPNQAEPPVRRRISAPPPEPATPISNDGPPPPPNFDDDFGGTPAQAAPPAPPALPAEPAPGRRQVAEPRLAEARYEIGTNGNGHSNGLNSHDNGTNAQPAHGHDGPEYDVPADDGEAAPVMEQVAPVAAAPAEPSPMPVEAPPAPPKLAPPRQGRLIRVQINPLGDWQDSCRQALHVAAQFGGNDMLVLHIPAHKLEMSFPNKPTLFCPELADALEAIQGVRRVEVEL